MWSGSGAPSSERRAGTTSGQQAWGLPVSLHRRAKAFWTASMRVCRCSASENEGYPRGSSSVENVSRGLGGLGSEGSNSDDNDNDKDKANDEGNWWLTL